MTSITSGPAVGGLALLALLTGCAASATPGAQAPPVLHLTGYSGGTAAAGAAPDTVGGPGPTPPPVAIGRPGSGYRLTGILPSGPVSARVFRFPAQVPVSAVRTLAQSLALTGTPVRHAYGWAVTGREGAQLLVRDDGAGQWSYLRQGGPESCLPQVDLDTAPGLGSGTACAVPAAPGAPMAAPPGPSAAVARAEASPVLAAFGLTGPDAKVQVGSPVTTVWADPVVGGRPAVGLTTTVSVDRSGVLAADGWLGAPVQGASYPLVTAAQALRSLSRMAHPMAAAGSGPAVPAIAVACPIPSGKVSPWCGGPTVITGARLGLALRYDDRAPVLVPAWLFSVAGDPTYPIVVTAVQPRYLAGPRVEAPGPSGVAGGGGGSAPVPPASAPGQPVGPG